MLGFLIVGVQFPIGVLRVWVYPPSISPAGHHTACTFPQMFHCIIVDWRVMRRIQNQRKPCDVQSRHLASSSHSWLFPFCMMFYGKGR